jgi:PAS domain S-box-containing protein
MISYKKIANLDKMKPGDHVVLLYKKQDEILTASVSFIKTSLDRNEKCLYIKGDLNENALLIELRKQISNIDLYIKKGQLQFLEKEETYALSSNFKAIEMIEKLKEESKKSLIEGYKGLAITGELSWVLNSENGKKEIIDYEWMLNEYIFNDYPVVAMCRYNLNKFDNSIIKAIIELHHYIIWNGEIHENPYYIPPEGYRDNKIIEYEIETWLKNIQNYKKRESIFKDKLIKSEKKYDNLYHSAPIGIVTTTSNGEVYKINKRMAEILGFDTIEEALEKYTNLSRDLYVDTERRDEFVKLIKKSGEVKSFEYRAIKKDGTQIWLSMNATIIEKNKDYFLIEAFVFDITDIKIKEKKINEQKEEIKASFEEIQAYNEEVMAMNEELKKSVNEFEDLNKRFQKMISLISNIDDLNRISEKEFLSKILHQAIEIVPEADFGSVYTFGEKYVNFIDCVGYDLAQLKKLNIPKESFHENSSKKIDIINIEKIIEKKQKFLNKKEFSDYRNISLDKHKEVMYFYLIINGEKKAGISLDIEKNSEKSFTQNSKKLFLAFYNIASSFYKIKEYNSLQNNFTKELITSIIKIMEMYDLYTKGHSENVAKLSSAIAKEMNLSRKSIIDTYWAGLVHDIGKLLIPLNVINKQGKLTDEEYDLIKKHPIWGNNALSSSKVLKHISEYVLYHHERWDGRGYPEGLKENKIPLISQILSVADAWDAMISKRSYRNSLSFEQALKEIKNNKGSQFSPLVVETFIKLVENNKVEKIQQEILNNEMNSFGNEHEILNNKVISEEFFEEANDGIVILDDNFKIIRANNFFIKMFG